MRPGDMATPPQPDRAGSELSRCLNHATSTAEGESPATPERRVELDDQELGRQEPGDGRFIIVATTANGFELWLFDKQLQSDEMHKAEIAFGVGAVHEIAARVVAWQLQGVNL